MQTITGIFVVTMTLTVSACALEAKDGSEHGTAMVSSAVSTSQLINAGQVCLGIQGSSTEAGANAVVGECAGTDTQTWHVHGHTTVGGEFGWQLENNAGKCLAVLGESTGGGAQVIQDDCSATSNHSQIWRPEIDRNGVLGGFSSSPGEAQYWLRNGHSGLCLGLKGSSTSGGTPAVQGSCNVESLTQRWDFAP